MKVKIIHADNEVLENKVNEFLASIDSPEYEVEDISFQFAALSRRCRTGLRRRRLSAATRHQRKGGVEYAVG